MKIAVYASARNEEKNLADWLETVADADHVAINDTGSTDHTVKILRRHAIHDPRLSITKHKIKPMTLSNALNTVLALLPEDIDVAIRLDLDERLQPGWRAELERTYAAHPGERIIVRPWFDHDGCLYRHTRIHPRDGFRWDLPVHEVLVDDTGGSYFVDADITIEHHQDPHKDRSQVLGELQEAVAAAPTDMRLVHYLAREYTYRGDWQSAIPLLLTHTRSDAYAEERSESWRLLGDAYAALLPIDEVPVGPFKQAATVAPDRREGWVALADICHQQGHWLECLLAAEKALTITERSWYFNQPYSWGARPYDLAALASWNLGHRDNAIRYGLLAIQHAPDDERLQVNLDWYRQGS